MYGDKEIFDLERVDLEVARIMLVTIGLRVDVLSIPMYMSPIDNSSYMLDLHIL